MTAPVAIALIVSVGPTLGLLAAWGMLRREDRHLFSASRFRRALWKFVGVVSAILLLWALAAFSPQMAVVLMLIVMVGFLSLGFIYAFYESGR